MGNWKIVNSNQVTLQTGAYLGFYSNKQQELHVFLLPLDWMLVNTRLTPLILY